jgi:hypothetical protein
MLDKCKYCNTLGAYAMTCRKCRHRLLMNEPCKLLRKYQADSIKRYGELDNWQIEPHCGCNGNICQRLKNMRLARAN